MMLDTDPAEFSGPIGLTFVFDSAEVTASAELRAIGDAMEGMDDMEMEDGEMDEMDDSDG